MVRSVVINDEFQLFDVQTSSSDGGGDDDWDDTRLEVSDRRISINLVFNTLSSSWFICEMTVPTTPWSWLWLLMIEIRRSISLEIRVVTKVWRAKMVPMVLFSVRNPLSNE